MSRNISSPTACAILKKQKHPLERIKKLNKTKQKQQQQKTTTTKNNNNNYRCHCPLLTCIVSSRHWWSWRRRKRFA